MYFRRKIPAMVKLKESNLENGKKMVKMTR